MSASSCSSPSSGRRRCLCRCWRRTGQSSVVRSQASKSLWPPRFQGEKLAGHGPRTLTPAAVDLTTGDCLSALAYGNRLMAASAATPAAKKKTKADLAAAVGAGEQEMEAALRPLVAEGLLHWSKAASGEEAHEIAEQQPHVLLLQSLE